jgi:hypothetical protein
MDLIDVAAKCRVLFLNHFWAQGDRSGSLTAEAQCKGLAISQDESPARKSDPSDHGIPTHFFHEWAYMEHHMQAETGRAFKRRVYDTLRTTSTAEANDGRCHRAASVI